MTPTEWKRRKTKKRLTKKTMKPICPKVSEMRRDYKMMAANDYD